MVLESHLHPSHSSPVKTIFFVVRITLDINCDVSVPFLPIPLKVIVLSSPTEDLKTVRDGNGVSSAVAPGTLCSPICKRSSVNSRASRSAAGYSKTAVGLTFLPSVMQRKQKTGQKIWNMHWLCHTQSHQVLPEAFAKNI